MQSLISRTLTAFEVTLVGALACFAAYRVPAALVSTRADTLLIAALLLVIVCGGLGMKLARGWSTRMLWEWMFVGAALLGGWVYPRLVVPGVVGTVLAAVCLFLPFFWTAQKNVRMVAFWIGAAGAGVLLASSLTMGPLWVLWGGLALYDVIAARSRKTVEGFLKGLGLRRGVSTELVSVTGLQTQIWASHLVLPAALIAQAAWRQPIQGLCLLLALLIGAWYAIMRSEEGGTRIVPWAPLWMLGTELLMRLAHVGG